MTTQQFTMTPAEWAARATDAELDAVLASPPSSLSCFTSDPAILARIAERRARYDAAAEEAQTRDRNADTRSDWYDPCAWALAPGRSYRASDRSDG